MIRILLTTVLPLLAPAILYGLWLLFARRQARDLDAGRDSLAVRVPWMALLLAGAALTAISLLYFGISSGTDPWADHRPPALRDGAVVPGGVR
ncbi:hypothetical protein EDC65_5390 [Stella humosa]|uniref:Uncharacterized protein n=1 Tax=Stella humosa TaxID=94 RepID=A0A3N1KUM5_9PROT|nr:DUF6111 family protein [Stella humosa]ROP81055.1 hypothetical protein EDC65_5390 [Stella humosa]BBK29745.1 hypothetical protein STHU_03790 [Stella humosa]